MWIEVWSPGFRQSLKISSETTKIYNDSIFGSLSWSKDLTRVCFIGEAPETPSYKNPWEDQLPSENNSQDEKFMYKEDFGDGMVGKRMPTIFVYDLVQNTI